MYRHSGRQEYLERRIAGASASEMPGRLRVLILGKDRGGDHFCDILAANVRRWGYEAVLVSVTMMHNAQFGQKIAGDILIYDMDVLLQYADVLGSTGAELASIPGDDLVAFKPDWPKARLNIVLSGSSVSRHTLERLGATVLLHKPFDMRALERYLRVFQRLLYPEVGLEEASELSGLDLAGVGCLARCEEGSGEGQARVARILVADDQKEITWGIRQCLMEQENQRYRYEVREVHEGLALLEQCLIWKPHCVVTDLLMPWLNGYQVMRCLASSTSWPKPVFVVISALMRHEFPVDRSYLRDQIVRYVDKPFDVEDLLNVIEQELAQ